MTQQQRFQSQSINDWLFYLQQQHPSEIELGLDRVQQIAQQAQLTDFANSKVVLVAGTNGKGTTIRFIESYLLSLGKRVGVYSSPHLFQYNERVRVNGEDASDDLHLQSLAFIEQARGDTALTFFEFGTLAGLHLLQQQQLDYVLIEVGLGGRLDATNIVNHQLAIVTSIGLDHVDWLGDDLNTIAFEKAGIFRAGQPAVIGEPERYPSFAEQAKNHKVSQYRQVGQDYHYQIKPHSWNVQLLAQRLDNLPLPLIPVQNVATALMALTELGVELSHSMVCDVLQKVTLTGRLQIVSAQPMKMVDVAHNSHAIDHLLNTLDTHPKFAQVESLDIVLAMMKDKDISESLQRFKGRVSTWYLADLGNNERAAKAQEVADKLHQLGETNVQLFDSVAQAWQAASKNQSPQSLLLGLGSFYTVAEILSQDEV